MTRYQNNTKAAARGWAWNRICDEIRGSFDRKRARIYVLIGETNLELEIAEKKGFSRYNVIGVDLKEEHVKRWRAAGGLAIQAPLEPVLYLSKVRPSAVIADFCGGITVNNMHVVLAALNKVNPPGKIICNMLRGRDQVRYFRHKGYEHITGRSELALIEFLYKYIAYTEEATNAFSFSEYDGEPLRTVKKSIIQQKTHSMWEQLNPQFYSYKSEDSSQWFDSMALHSLPETPSETKEDKSIRLQFEHALAQQYDIPLIKRRMAALEAVRTQKLNKLPTRKRESFSAPTS